MRDADISEFRCRAEHLFDLVEAGEVVRVLRHAKPIAEIHPGARDRPSWKRRVARPLAIDGVSLSRFVLEERGR